MNELEKFVFRLKRIGINVQLFGNYPWIYLDTVNGNKIKTKFESEHGFVLCYSPIRKNQGYRFTNLKKIFEEIRKTL